MRFVNMSRTGHLGFQLNENRPIDKQVMDILDNLPDGEKKCSFIRKAIIFYNDNKDKSFDNIGSSDKLNDRKLDMILEKLDEVIKAERLPESERESPTSQPSSPPLSKAEEPEAIFTEEPGKEEDKDHLEVSTENNVNSEDYMNALGDFLM